LCSHIGSGEADVPRLTEEQNQLLEKLVDGYWSGRGARGKEDFYFGASMGLGTTLTHRSLDEDEVRVDVGDIEELERFDFVIVNWRADLAGNLKPTGDGKVEVEQRRRAQAIAKADNALSGGGPGVRWVDTLPVLEAIVALTKRSVPVRKFHKWRSLRRWVGMKGTPVSAARLKFWGGRDTSKPGWTSTACRVL
jgi:hypothetical protein